MTKLPLKIKERAIKLREKGYSVKEIAERLYIAKSTSSLWLRDIKLNKKALTRLKKRRLLGYYKAALRWREKRVKEERKNLFSAKEIVDNIKRDLYHNKLYCSLLFWCEGGKTYKAGVRFYNSDPILVKTFLNLFRKSFKINEKKFRILMHLHEYHDEEAQKKFWSKLTKIPKSQFNMTFQKPHTKKRIKENYPGCVALYYHDRVIARELRAIYKAFSEIN